MTGNNPGDVTSPRWAGGTPAAVETELKTLRAENERLREARRAERRALVHRINDYRDDLRALAVENEKALKALAESRARFGDVEARLVEAEAVIHKLDLWADEDRYKISGDHSTWTEWHQGIESAQEEVLHIIDPARRSVVLADRDKAVRQVALREAADAAMGPSVSGILHDGATARDIAGAIRALAEGDTNA